MGIFFISFFLTFFFLFFFACILLFYSYFFFACILLFYSYFTFFFNFFITYLFVFSRDTNSRKGTMCSSCVPIRKKNLIKILWEMIKIDVIVSVTCAA